MGGCLVTNARISTEQGLSWLLSRLTWPSIRVRERASVELGALLWHPELGGATHSALLQWIAAQRLESLAALGLLPFLRAHMEDRAYTAPLADVVKSLQAPSPLAWLLLNELDVNGVPVAVRQKTTLRTGCVVSAMKVARGSRTKKRHSSGLDHQTL